MYYAIDSGPLGGGGGGGSSFWSSSYMNENVGHWTDYSWEKNTYWDGWTVIVTAKKVYNNLATIIVNRIKDSEKSTLGKYTIYKYPYRNASGYILEPAGPSTSKRNQDQRIPPGEYLVQPYNSGNHPSTYIVTNEEVPEDRRILIHIGNYHTDTEGCLLPGKDCDMRDGEYVVWSSKDSMELVRTIVGDDGALLYIYEFTKPLKQ
jgi:hypothetical protein